MKYLIWDFDGTLAERKGMWWGALLEALDAHRPGAGAISDSVRPFLQTRLPWHEPHNTRNAKVTAGEWWQALYPVFVRAYCQGLQLEHAEAHGLCKAVREAYVNPKHWALF